MAVPVVLNVVEYRRDRVRMIDQTKLPGKYVHLTAETPAQMHDAIKRLVVRGAPAIGVAAAYGVLLGLDHPVPDDFRKAGKPDWANPRPDTRNLRDRVLATADYLATSRPTAVNLFHALDHMRAAARAAAGRRESPAAFRQALVAQAHAFRDKDLEMGEKLAEFGRPLVRPRQADASVTGVLTHCNAGRLASSGHGLALAPVYAAHAEGQALAVHAGETRPLCQGARLTAWELAEAGVPVTLICDDMAAQVMREGRVDLVVIGADRIAANGDTANKIGSYGLAVLARYHRIPFYVVAPSSTFDLTLADGGGIPIEQRGGDEIRDFFGRATAPARVPVYNPAFDVTPAELITAIVTDQGVIHRPNREKIGRRIKR